MGLQEQAPPPNNEPGWYPDPLGGDKARYFDGTGWTDRITGDHSSDPASPARNKKGKASWRPGWRKMTWAILIWSALMLLWIIVGIAGADNAEHCVNETNRFLDQQTCTDARDAGTGIAVAFLFFLWFIGFTVLSLIWFMTRPKGRDCPACGEKVKKGRTVCPNCQFDFAASVGHELPAS